MVHWISCLQQARCRGSDFSRTSQGSRACHIHLAIFGITVGNLLMLQPLLIAERYGLLQYSRIYAVSNLLTMLGIATGPVTMGYLFALTGTYGLAYLAAAVAGVIAFLIFLGNSAAGRVLSE